VVFPNGLNRAWADLRPNTKRAGRAPPEGTDDVGFIAALIEKFVSDGAADPGRIYITGLSNGGAMTMTMICARADLFAAAASVIFNLTGDMATSCHPAKQVPMLMINGTADPLIPYEGGRGSSRFAVPGFWSTQQTFDFWRRVNGCDARDSAAVEIDHRDPSDPTMVTRISPHCP
jgi:polyhydroxybutyrate depolymerase